MSVRKLLKITVPNYIPSYAHNLSDTNVLQKEFDVTKEDVWYFAPRFIDSEPYGVAICLIWTSPFTEARKPDVSNDVSKSKSNTLLNRYIAKFSKVPIIS